MYAQCSSLKFLQFHILIKKTRLAHFVLNLIIFQTVQGAFLLHFVVKVQASFGNDIT